VASAGERLDVADTSTDWQAFVRRDDLDLISVCTPVHLHAEQTIAAIDAGKHVLVEKPLALTAEDAELMASAAESAGVAHAVCFEGRYEPHRASVWRLVEDGFIGQPYVARAANSQEYWHPARALQSEWMYSLEGGGGYLMGLSSHDIDYLCFLLGTPEAVCADVRTTVPARQRPDGSTVDVDADDTSVVLLRMQSGALATISTSVVGLHTNRRQLELVGSDGTIMVDGPVQGGDATVLAGGLGDEGLRSIPQSERTVRSGLAPPKRRAAGAIQALALMLEDWLPAFGGKSARGVPTLADGSQVQQVIDAARRSSAGEGWVSLT
jgi:predicted dehydrogenase